LARPLLLPGGMEARAFFLTLGRTLGDRWRHLSRRTALAIVLTLIVSALAFFIFSWDRCFFATCPDVGRLAAYQPGGAPLLLDRNGEVFADLTPVEHATVPLGTLPSLVAQAFLAVEDKRFQEHRGIDWRRVGGAIVADLRSGSFEQGFSTITMQLARNLFPDRLPGREQSLARKLLEVRVARDIEQRFSKQEILELYLNHIYFGNRAHGIEAASRQYFGVPAVRLTLPQAALLAALPKAPSHYDPRRHPEAAQERRNLVLDLMAAQGRIARREAAAARVAPLGIVPPPRQSRVEAGLAPWFVEQVRRDLEERFGADLYSRPLRIRTTLDSRAQRAAEEELARQLKALESGQQGTFSGPRYAAEAVPEPDGTAYLQGAVVTIDPRNGDVLAWVGGRNFSHSQFDRAAMARRQAGSAFKPFVYAEALRAGWVLSQPLADTPLSVRLGNGQVWQPKNFSGRYEGEVTLRDALVRSKNVATVRLADAVGLGAVAAAAHRAGIDQPLPELPSIALGTAAVSPVELTTAYTPFAGLGAGVEPRMILAVEDEDGHVLWRPEPRRRDVLDPGIAYLITDVLTEALERGTGIAALRGGLKVPAAGKTGTTNDGADAWFVGYTPDLVTGVWIGFDKPRPILEDATGGRLAAPIWGRIMERFYTGRKPPAPWHRPDSVAAHRVDPATGLLLKAGCTPAAGTPYEELFLDRTTPAAYCPGQEAVPRDGFPTARLAAAERDRATQQRAEKQKAEEEKRAELARQEEARRKEQERIARERKEKEDLADRQARLQEEEKRRAAREAALHREEEEQKRSTAAKDAQAAKTAKDAKEKKKEEKADREAAERARAEQERAARATRRNDPESRGGEDEEAIASSQEIRPEPRRPEPLTDDVEDIETQVEPADDLSGWWELTNRIEETNYESFRGLRLGYRLQLEQDGNRITGRGQKWSEDGRARPAGGRTPLTVRGTVEGETVSLEFTEHGARRSTSGSFQWRIARNGSTLRGTFSSTAAATSGWSVARRLD
jgi:1A family penicillin-binding protein